MHSFCFSLKTVFLTFSRQARQPALIMARTSARTKHASSKKLSAAEAEEIRKLKAELRRSRGQKRPIESSSSSEDEDINTARGRPARPHKVEPDISECEYTLVATTFLEDKSIYDDSNIYKLGGFQVREYDTESCKEVAKAADKAKLTFEHVNSHASVSATKIKAINKTIRDPSDWENVEKLIANLFKEKAKNIRVEYIINHQNGVYYSCDTTCSFSFQNSTNGTQNS
jgi:hypothetical protein